MKEINTVELLEIDNVVSGITAERLLNECVVYFYMATDLYL